MIRRPKIGPTPILLVAAVTLGACGKKGPPLAPFTREPAPIVDLQASRRGDEVRVRFTVRDVNNDGFGPADLARVEVWAVTANRPPGALNVSRGRDREHLTLVATTPVRRPLPPLPPDAPEPSRPLSVPEDGVDQGTIAVLVDPLAPEDLVPVVPPEAADERRRREAREKSGAALPAMSRPAVAPGDSELPARYYYAVGVNRSGRYGPTSPPVAVPVAAPPGAPSAPEVSYTETALIITWQAPPDARAASIAPVPPALAPSNATADQPAPLAARPLAPERPPTRYHVYEV
ncbi:MAG: hypothetical protein AB1635_21685, partial [Acidobacteriota bacterium]